MNKFLMTAAALVLTATVAQAAPRSAENDATAVAVVAIYINTCDTALSAKNARPTAGRCAPR
jgi:hypothetical protein